MQLVVVMAVRKAVSAATTTFTAISITRFFIGHLLSLVLVEAVVTLSRAGVDHQRAGLCGHREVAGVHTTALSELHLLAVQRCRRRLTLRRRDTDLHLIVLIQACARSHSVAIVSDRG